eukprot:TRINITY_DN2278_c0_g1_i3.p1 TRINITY_DN2278_c0_g1~~TRINITY_DN2278_c0_g1_i3.p1  ORF type:complete len:457 (-),score=58.56 TRINITY_DN2278_c0_g1_i3:46-1416(-)
MGQFHKHPETDRRSLMDKSRADKENKEKDIKENPIRNTRLCLVEKSSHVSAILFDYFYMFVDTVTVSQGDVLNYEGYFDCFICWSESPYVHILSEFLSEFFSLYPEIYTEWKKYILERYGGEQPIYSSFVLQAPKTCKWKFVMFVCTGKNQTHSEASYFSMREALIRIREWNRQLYLKPNHYPAEYEIKTVLAPIVSRSPTETEEACQQMFQAYISVFTFSTIENVEHQPMKPTLPELLHSNKLHTRWIRDTEINDVISFLGQQSKLRNATIKFVDHILNVVEPDHTIKLLKEQLLKTSFKLLIHTAETKQPPFLYRRITESEISLGDQIAEGSSAKVYQGEWRRVGVAVTFLINMVQQTDFHRELVILSLIDHPNIVRCYGGSLDSTLPFMVCELAERGSLQNLLNDASVDITDQSKEISSTAAEAMSYLHQHSIIHASKYLALAPIIIEIETPT